MSYYLHCPLFDTNFRIILPRFSRRLAGLSVHPSKQKALLTSSSLDGNLKVRAVCLFKLRIHHRGVVEVCCHGSVSSDRMGAMLWFYRALWASCVQLHFNYPQSIFDVEICMSTLWGTEEANRKWEIHFLNICASSVFLP